MVAPSEIDLISDDFAPLLREFTVQYDTENLRNKAALYALILDTPLSFSVDIHTLETLGATLDDSQKNEDFDQLCILLTSWPTTVDHVLLTQLLNACIESWIGAALNGASVSEILNTMACLHLTHADDNQQQAFHRLIVDLICETLFQHQSYQIDYLLEHDAITNLPNKHVLMRELTHLTQESTKFSLLALRFIIERGTTSVSPSIPAELSITIVDLLLASLPEGALIFQSGYLLFHVILDKSFNTFQISLLYARIKGNFEAIINCQQQAFLVIPVMGAVTDTHHKPSSELLLHAKLALENALSHHQDYVVYHAEISELAHQQKRLELEVIAAFNNEDLELYLQPIVALPVGNCVGAEVLLRWPSAQNKGIYPNVVIDLINKVGLGKMFTRWLIHSVCRLASELIHQHQLNLYLTLNIRAEDLYDIELPIQVQQSCDFWKIQPSDLILEITENGILEENETTRTTIQQLTQGGFKLALDDFGTGYSSMARLRNMPISLIKIDQSFVKHIDRSIEDMKIVESMALLGQSLGKEVLVEGLETADGLALINQIGISKAQGYFFSKPMPFDDFVIWSKNKSTN